MAVLDGRELRRRQRVKNVALALALLAFVLLFFMLTIVKIGGAAL
jgi:hypothetical protein